MTAFGPQLRAALLSGRREGPPGHGASSLRRSDGYEFAELRAYVEGDDPRRIDWAATARAGALQSRVMLEERTLSLAVALDASHSMHVGRNRSNYELACAAAGAWYSAATGDDRCTWLGAQAFVCPELRGRAAAAACAARREPPGTVFEHPLRLALAVLPRGARLLVAGDFYELGALLPTLRACAARFELTALVVRDPWFDSLPLGGFARLRDAETGGTVRVYIDRPARERYYAAVARREAGAVETLRRAGARAGILAEGSGPEAALATVFRLRRVSPVRS